MSFYDEMLPFAAAFLGEALPHAPLAERVVSLALLKTDFRPPAPKNHYNVTRYRVYKSASAVSAILDRLERVHEGTALRSELADFETGIGEDTRRALAAWLALPLSKAVVLSRYERNLVCTTLGGHPEKTLAAVIMQLYGRSTPEFEFVTGGVLTVSRQTDGPRANPRNLPQELRNITRTRFPGSESPTDSVPEIRFRNVPGERRFLPVANPRASSDDRNAMEKVLSRIAALTPCPPPCPCHSPSRPRALTERFFTSPSDCKYLPPPERDHPHHVDEWRRHVVMCPACGGVSRLWRERFPHVAPPTILVPDFGLE